MITTHTTQIIGNAGRIEISIDVPEKCTRGIVFLAHPLTIVGGDNTHKVITTLAKAVTASGFIAVRPNFRGAGNSDGTFDRGPGECDDFLHVIDSVFEMRGIAEALPVTGRVVYAGFSFGSFVASLAASKRKPDALILAGPAIGKYPYPKLNCPTWVVHAQHDEVASLETILDWSTQEKLPVTVIAGTDHVFNRKMSILGHLMQDFLKLV